MECFLNVFFVILQSFLKLPKKNNTYEELLLELVNIWIRTTALTAKILRNITGMTVIFIIRTIFIFATAAFSRFGLLLSMTVVFWVWALLCALGLRRLLIYWRSWLQSYHRGMKVPVSFSHLQPDKHGSHFCISLFNAPNNKYRNKDSLVSVR